jgi:Uma2 family endonuclease
MGAIKLPAGAKPAFEWINGRAVRKVSPKRRHSLAQMRFAQALDSWARRRGAGMVGTEWQFDVQPPGEERRPLVPDVAFLSYGTLSYERQLATEVPRVAPDIVVEVWSPNDRRSDLLEKIRVYLKAGTSAVFVVHPTKRTVAVHSAAGVDVANDGDVLRHPALPGFRMPVSELFTLPLPKRGRPQRRADRFRT